MNKNNIEVELRFRADKKTSVHSWLKKNAKLQYQHKQVDDYYTPAHRDFFEPEIPIEYLRIRRSGSINSITYKYWHGTGVAREYPSCDEYETEIKDAAQMEKIFKALDLELLVTVAKTRFSYLYKGFEIDIDEVKGLGLFCEIEVKGEYKSVTEARAQIMELAKDIGFKEEDRGDDLKLGYAYILGKMKRK